MNAHKVGGVFRAGVLVLCVFLFVCFLTLKWGDITIQSATAVFPVVVTGNAGYGEEKLTLQSLQKTPLHQRDPSLLPLARRVLIPPSSLPYNLDSVGEHSHGQAQLIKKLFRGKVILESTKQKYSFHYFDASFSATVSSSKRVH